MTAGPLHTLHLLPTAVTEVSPSYRSAGDDRAHLDAVAVFEACIAGHERAVADHEMGFAVEPEFFEKSVDAATTFDLDLPPRVAQQDLHEAC